jgi:hypothetical protein
MNFQGPGLGNTLNIVTGFEIIFNFDGTGWNAFLFLFLLAF